MSQQVGAHQVSAETSSEVVQDAVPESKKVFLVIIHIQTKEYGNLTSIFVINLGISLNSLKSEFVILNTFQISLHRPKILLKLYGAFGPGS